MDERPILAISAVRPVKLDGLPAASLHMIPPPMIDDTIDTCDHCGQDVWVSPLKMVLYALSGTPKWCYRCVAAAMAGEQIDVGRINTDRAEVPRVGRLPNDPRGRGHPRRDA